VNGKDFAQLQPGERTNASGKAVNNRILLSIADSEFAGLRPHLEFLESLHEPHQKLEFAYFPNSGMISLVVVTENGKTVEVGLVGKEGMTATPAPVDLPTSPLCEIVQIAGDGFRLPVEVLRDVLRSSPEFKKILSRYAVA
jgi:hypothetical protein